MRRLKVGLCAAAIAAAAGIASATPLRLDYCVEPIGGGQYQYSFTLTNDNNDGSWSAGQTWSWIVFGDGSGMSSPLTNFAVDPASLPIGPFASVANSGGGHNGPTLLFDAASMITYWVPSSVGDSLTWRGTSSAFLDQGSLLWSTLLTQNGGVPANFVTGNRLTCNETFGACCRSDGTCINTSSSGCTAEGGVYHGDGSTCGGTNCPQPPTGACCSDSGCSVTTQALCSGINGVYHGDNSTCGAAGCGAATAFRENPDAGDVPSTAAIANNGTGTLSTIHGSFHNFTDADMYEIQICDPANFSAHLVAGGIGTIYLFDVNGNGISQRFAFNGPATITNQFVSSLPAGNYYVAVATFLKSPLDASGQQLWLNIHNNTFDNIERRPDGPGASNPIDHWDQGGGGPDSAYEIDLTGACFVGGNPPPTCYANCDHSTNVPFLNVNDFICFQTQFAAGASYANCDHSTTPPVLNVNDFICFQTQFATGCSAP